MRKKFVIVTIALFFGVCVVSFAQDALGAVMDMAGDNELPSGFRAYSLGMSIDELKTNLTADTYFVFRGDRDVSFLPVTKQNLVESEGRQFIKRAFFQLKDEKIFIMSFTLNTELIDHYSVYTAFVKKYGEPLYLNPKEAVWENGTTRISIERPLSIKYIDRTVFDTLVDSSNTRRAEFSEIKEEFLNDF
jgi:hypothetical protein